MRESEMANAKWRIGDITVTRLFEAGVAAPHPMGGEQSLLPLAYPEAIKTIGWMAPHWADERGYLRMSLHALLVETPTVRLIVDTCVGNDKPRSGPLNMWSTSFLADLEAAGWPRESVNGVLCTHLHTDHVGWNTMLVSGVWVPTFPNARYYMAADEIRHWQEEVARGAEMNQTFIADMEACFNDSVKPILDAGLEEPVQTDATITPGIRLIPTPGHTPGHVSVVIESSGDRAVITGDLMHHPCQIAHLDWSSQADADPDDSVRSRHMFCEMFADNSTLVIGTHFGGPTAGCLYRDDTGGYWLDGGGRASDFRIA
jgi:glyoxylase-like metal-dependent hydrolase (beta-lactamase superfamily II)